jgi:hypothetical protein
MQLVLTRNWKLLTGFSTDLGFYKCFSVQDWLPVYFRLPVKQRQVLTRTFSGAGSSGSEWFFRDRICGSG